MKRLFNFMATMLVALLAMNPAKAGEIVLSVEGGMAFMGDSGLNDIGPLERDEMATSWLVGGGAAYQMPLAGGRIRFGLGMDYLGNTDGDWGVTKSHGRYTATARQIVDVKSLAGILSAEYDINQVQMFGISPFVGGGIRLQQNWTRLHTAELSVTDGERSGSIGCQFDDNSNTDFGWHGLAGLSRDFGAWNARVFWQYTDRGDVQIGGEGTCNLAHNGEVRKSKDVYAAKETIDLTSHEVRLRVSYAF